MNASSADADVIVVGAGHNNLIAAGYLAAAGRRVLVLERNDAPGGGVASGEFTAPGFVSDRAATFHLRILANPLITHDELGLFSTHGLDYVRLETPYSAIFTDGTTVPVGRDRDATRACLEQFSPPDSAAYDRFMDRAIAMTRASSPALFAPPPDPGAQSVAMGSTPLGREMMRVSGLSMSRALAEWFTDDRTLITLSRMVSELTLAHPDTPGTGTAAYLAPGLVELYGAALPRGGGSTFTEACVRCLVGHGGEIRTGVVVERVLTRAGRVVGVRTAHGAELRARDAVLAAIHPHHLGAMIEGLAPAIAAAGAATEISALTAVVVHAALDEPLRLRGGGDQTTVWNTLSGPNLSEMTHAFDDLRGGRLPVIPLLEAGCPSTPDPSRAPDGGGVLHMLGLTTRELVDGGPQRWDSVRDEVADTLMARLAEFTATPPSVRSRVVATPLDHERASPSFVGGDYTGLAQHRGQMAGARPIPELAQYGVPGVRGLYLAGPFMHPGGGVVGGGRATAMRMIDDLGLDPALFSTS